ncbi:MAG TPA: sugar-binding protein [Lacipirellulaceae bacterium]|nr:sugar-binding protein [Lacipirellulaceae bacterium]
MNRLVVLSGITMALLITPGCNRGQNSGLTKATPSYAFITNGVADFWKYAEAGVNQAGRDLGVNVSVITPNSITDQTRKIEDLLTRGTDGIAISPIDPDNQVETINMAAAKTNLIAADADAPRSNRLMYIGMDNYRAGLVCGQTLRDAMPDGGTVMIFVGRLDQDNAKRRRQGFIDAMLGRKPDPDRHDPPGGELTSDDKKIIILGTMTDQFDFAKAKANVEDTLTRYPNIAGMVGLFEYNPPMIIEALDRLGKLGKVKVMAFDENFATLQGIKDGTIIATVVQNPYQYGYESIHVLNELHRGNKSVIPANKAVEFPARLIDKSNVDEFWTKCKKLLGSSGTG